MRKKAYTNVSAIVAGAPFQVRLPVPGPTIDKILLRMGNTAGAALTDITNIKVVIGGNTVMEFANAGVIDSINQFLGRDAAGGAGTVASPREVCIYFSQPDISSALGMTEVAAERVTALRTGGVTTAYIEATIAGAGAFCNAYGYELPTVGSEDAYKGYQLRIKRFTYPGAAAGRQNILDNIPRGPRLPDGKGGTNIMQVFLADADVSLVTLKENSYAVIDEMPKAALQVFQNQDGRVPVAGYTVLDFVSNGNLNEALAVHPDRTLEGTITLDNAGSFDAYVVYLDSLASGL